MGGLGWLGPERNEAAPFGASARIRSEAALGPAGSTRSAAASTLDDNGEDKAGSGERRERRVQQRMALLLSRPPVERRCRQDGKPRRPVRTTNEFPDRAGCGCEAS